MPWEVHGRGSHKQSSNTDLATWAQASTQAWSSITGCFLSSPYLGLQPTLWPSEIKAPRLASALAPCPDFPVCLEDRALGKKWGLYKVGSSYCTDGETGVQRSSQGDRTIPMAESHTTGLAHCLAASSPDTLHWVLWTAGKGGGGALEGHGEGCWDLKDH